MEILAPNSKFVGHSTEIIRQSKIEGPFMPNCKYYHAYSLGVLDFFLYFYNDFFFSSIARTNLECDIVQRGGTLVQGRGFADQMANTASTSGATPKAAKMTFDSNRNKFCFGK